MTFSIRIWPHCSLCPILTDSVPPPSSLWPPKYQVMCAGGLDPVLRQTISDSRPTTNRSTLLTMFTLTGATEKNCENAMFQNIVNFGAKIQTRKTISYSRPTTNRSIHLVDDVPEHLKKIIVNCNVNFGAKIQTKQTI